MAHCYPDLRKFLVAVDIVWENAIRGNDGATQVSFPSDGDHPTVTRIQTCQRFGRSRLSCDSRDSSGGTDEKHETSEQRSGSWSITVCCLPCVTDY